MLDGVNLSKLRLSWLRKQIGLVSQEPVLFELSVRENILYGATGDDEAITEEQMIAAAKAANAHKFVSALPNGCESQCDVFLDRFSVLLLTCITYDCIIKVHQLL